MAVKRGVIIANTGSPASPDPEDVAVYLQQFLGNPRIVPMNPLVWKHVLKHAILPKRSVASGAKYATIWDDGFAFIKDHVALAEKLERSLADDGEDTVVRAAMSFGAPSIPDVMNELEQLGCRHITVLPLYPQNAFSQAYIVADEVYRHARKMRWDGDLDVIGDYSANETYLRAIADTIRLSDFGSQSDDRLIMGFHSVPVIDVRNGDTYEETTRSTCEWLADALALPQDSWIRAYQCRFDKRRPWLEPYAQDVLDGWWSEGFDGRIFYICPNFSVDCLETYHDVIGVLRAVWLGRKLEAGKKIYEDSFVYLPCLGKSDAHVAVLKDVLRHPLHYIV